MHAQLKLGEIDVDVVFKDIRNIHLSVYPPDGRVHISAPQRMKLDNIRVFALDKIAWIRDQQQKMRGQERETPREFITGESHYLWGRRYLLEVVERHGAHQIVQKHHSLLMYVCPGTTKENRELLMGRWYRVELKNRIPELLAKWEPIIGRQAAEWGVKRMKTKWGSCNTDAARIWLNLELAKKSPECLEYILVHEMVHLLERCHNDRFRAYMDRFLPQWRHCRDTLNGSPLGHEDWVY